MNPEKSAGQEDGFKVFEGSGSDNFLTSRKMENGVAIISFTIQDIPYGLYQHSITVDYRNFPDSASFVLY